MNTPSCTPEALPRKCQVCGKSHCIEPSNGTRNATCTSCGSLVWYAGADFAQPQLPQPRRPIWPAMMAISLIVATILVLLLFEDTRLGLTENATVAAIGIVLFNRRIFDR